MRTGTPIVAFVTDPNTLPEPYQWSNPGPAEPEQVLVTIGDIAITRTFVIVPAGRYPLRGTTWTVQDSTQVTETISSTGMVLGIVCAVLGVLLAFFTCGLSLFLLLGLLFLIMKDKKVTGFVTVNVMGEGLYHSCQLAPGEQAAGWAMYQVNQARALAAAA